MRFEVRRSGVIGAIAALGAVAACNRTSPTMDSGLKADIQAAGASHSAAANLVISPDEAGPNSAPTRRPAAHVPRPSRTATVRVARRETPAVTAAPQQATQPAPVTTAPVAPAPAPQPAAMPTPGPTERQPGVYKSEGEIFRQMPWIRP